MENIVVDKGKTRFLFTNVKSNWFGGRKQMNTSIKLQK